MTQHMVGKCPFFAALIINTYKAVRLCAQQRFKFKFGFEFEVRLISVYLQERDFPA